MVLLLSPVVFFVCRALDISHLSHPTVGELSSNASGDISDRYQKGKGVVSRRVCRKLNYNFEINICLVG